MARSPAPAPGFDRSSWITLVLVLAIIGLSLGIAAAASGMPTDGWLVDRGAWGRYQPLIFLEPIRPENATALQPGDVLLAVEGVAYDQLEALAAGFRPPRPSNWQIGSNVQYTVLRHNEAVPVAVTLVRTPMFYAYADLVLVLSSPLLLTFPLFFAISIVVFALRPRERPAQLLFLFGTAFFNENLLSYMAALPGVADLFSVVTYWPRIILGNMLWSYLIGPLLVHLFLIFPVRKALLRRTGHLAPLLVYGFFGAASLGFVAWNATGHFASGVTFVTGLSLPSLVAVGVSLVHSWRTVSEPVARMQARWVALGGIVGIIGPVGLWIAAGGLSPSTPFWQSLLYLLLGLALPISLAIAILRYRLWDIEVIIRRTLVYSVLSGALAGVYYAGVVTLQALFRALPGQPQSPIVIVLSTLAVAALFFPLRQRVQRAVDRRFYRRKYDAARTLAAFSATARDQPDLQRLTAQLVNVVDETMRPAHLSLWLPTSDGAETGGGRVSQPGPTADNLQPRG